MKTYKVEVTIRWNNSESSMVREVYAYDDASALDKAVAGVEYQYGSPTILWASII